MVNIAATLSLFFWAVSVGCPVRTRGRRAGARPPPEQGEGARLPGGGFCVAPSPRRPLEQRRPWPMPACEVKLARYRLVLGWLDPCPGRSCSAASPPSVPAAATPPTMATMAPVDRPPAPAPAAPAPAAPAPAAPAPAAPAAAALFVSRLTLVKSMICEAPATVGAAESTVPVISTRLPTSASRPAP